MDEFDIREAHGVACANEAKWLLGTENAQTVNVALRGQDLAFTPDQARRFATMLRRLANRVEARNP